MDNESSWATDRAALIVSSRRGHARTDRAFLTKMRITVPAILESGARAAEFLLRTPTGVVLCDEELSDMSGLEFLALVRLHPRLAALPVIALSRDNTLEAVLQAMDAGCAGYLIRPYSLRSFTRNMRRVMGPLPGREWAPGHGEEQEEGQAFRQALEALVPQPPEPDPAGELCARGEAHLAGGRLDEAVACFGKAAQADPLAAAAHQGLARAWKAKGRPDLHRRALRDASVAMLGAGRREDARKAVAGLRKAAPDAQNPVLDAAGDMVRRNEYVPAARLYAQALGLREPEEHILSHVARNCHFTSDPIHSARAMSQELAATGHFAEAPAIYARIMGPSLPDLDGPPPSPRARTGSLGFLREAAAVAGYTFQAFRQNGAA